MDALGEPQPSVQPVHWSAEASKAVMSLRSHVTRSASSPRPMTPVPIWLDSPLNWTGAEPSPLNDIY